MDKIPVYNSYAELAAANGCTVFNTANTENQPPKSIGQRIADTASAANDWMAQKIGLAVPTAQEYKEAFDKRSGPIARDAVAGFKAGRESVEDKFPVKPDMDPGSTAFNTIVQGLVGAGTAGKAMLGGIVDRRLDKIFPKTYDVPNNDHLE